MRTLFLIAAIFCYSNHLTLSAQAQGTDPGNRVPEIRLATPAGDTLALSSLKGKLVLIDFWATWCEPCVKEQTELGKLYKKYRNANFTNGRGFEIYGVSLDSKKSNWQDFIKKKSIDWIQVSDLKFWASPVAKLYDIKELPFNVLIDGNGVVVAKNLHGNALENEIARIVK